MTESGRSASARGRQQVIDALCEHYARDNLELGEFERRLDRANRASREEELRDLVSDLPALQPPEGSSPPAPEPRSGSESLPVPQGAGRADPARVPDSQFEFAVWSGRSRTGSWVPARTIRAVAFMGGVELDFREALFGPEEVRVHAVAVMGGIEIIVPPHVHVDVSGFALLGGFEEQLEGGGEVLADAPTVRVTGAAVLGGVEIVTRLPGESSAQARRRRKSEARRLRDERRRRLGDG
jgi:hypothetical protein